jgi:enamine deaminase RidA (YjgF/YER057c/UK114 family)
MDSHTQIKDNIIFTDQAPAPLGTYFQGVRVGNTVYLAAQTPVVPKTNEIAEGGFEGQLHQTFKNLCAMTEACGCTLKNIV